MPRPTLDLIIKNVRVVHPTPAGVVQADLGVRDGQIARVEPGVPPRAARQVYDGHGQLAFPGVVDAHTHVGIYGPLADDAVTESRAAVSGGVTTMLTYFRTGQYYLNRGGRYADVFPEVLKLSEGRYHCDYGYHLAPIAAGHLDEMEPPAVTHRVPTSTIIMSYLADETGCVNVNLLHLSSRKALESARTMAAAFPHVDFRREVTVGHLLLDTDAPAGAYAKVNPPIRPRDDVEYLWSAVLDGQVDWIVSDHACCAAETKAAGKGAGDVWQAKSGFGGNGKLLPGVVYGGHRLGLAISRVV